MTQHSDFLRLLVSYSWRNIKISFAFSSIIRDASFRFPSPSHRLFVTQHSDFSQLFVTLHSNFSSPHHGQVFINYILLFLSFSPVYLSELMTVYHPSTQLRSISDTRSFCIPFIKIKTFGQRAFSFTGPTQWNSLPYDVRHSASTSFK